MALKLEDLVPEEATFELSTKPGLTFTVRPYSLFDDVWLKREFGENAKIETILGENNHVIFAKIVYHLLKDTATVPTLDDFLKAIVSGKDRDNFIKALLKTIGFSQPILDDLEKAEVQKARDGAAKSPNV